MLPTSTGGGEGSGKRAEIEADGDRSAGRGKVMFLIRSLEHGGAERQLVTLTRALHARRRPIVVVTFYGGGALESELLEGGVPLRVLGKSGRWDVIPFLRRLVTVVKQEQPAVLHGYLTMSNLLVSVVRLLAPGVRTVWSIRDSGMDSRRYDWTIGLTQRVEGALARFVDVVIANSWSGRQQRAGLGFPLDRIEVIPNGIDVARFHPDRSRGQPLRREWGIAPGDELVGVVARLDPMKDHQTFLRSAATVARERPEARFVVVGGGSAEYTRELRELSRGLGLEERVIWAGAQNDMPAVYNALDLLCSPSAYGEGFSNAIGEAMACGVGCVVTDVGDAARIVGGMGEVVSPGDAQALAAAIVHALSARRDPAAVRAHAVENFSVDHLVEATERVLWPAV